MNINYKIFPHMSRGGSGRKANADLLSLLKKNRSTFRNRRFIFLARFFFLFRMHDMNGSRHICVALKRWEPVPRTVGRNRIPKSKFLAKKDLQRCFCLVVTVHHNFWPFQSPFLPDIFSCVVRGCMIITKTGRALLDAHVFFTLERK